ncbi:MAG: OsmC family peroxiredoxin [Anaerolineales bacterium]
MPTRKAQATWEGTLNDGNGTVKLGSGAFEGRYNFSSRFEEGTGTNPEELLGAAHAGCYSMKLNAMLHAEGISPEKIDTTAHVTIEKIDGAMTISKITLEVVGHVPGIDAAKFESMAQAAHEGCIVSVALGAVPEIVVNARLA